MQQNLQLFEKEKISKAMLMLSAPSVTAMLITALQQIISTAFVGMLDNTDLLAAVSLSFPLFTVINAVGQMVGIGASAAGGRKLGEQNQKKYDGIAALSVLTAVVLSAVILALGLIFLKPLVTFLGSTDKTGKYALTYAAVLICGAVFPVLNMVFNNLFRCIGKVVHSMITMLLAAFLNVGLDALFLFVFKWGALGVALALVLSQAAAVLYSVIYFIAKKQINFKSIKDIKKGEVFKEIFAVGLPTLIMQTLSSISFGILNSAAAKISSSAVAAFGIGNKIYMLVFQTVLGYTQAFLPFCAYNYGKKEQNRLKQGLKFSLILTMSLTLGFTALFFFAANPLCSIFSGSEEVVKLAALSLIAHSIPLCGVAFVQTMTVYYQACKQPFFAGLLSIARQGIFLIPLSLILPAFIKPAFYGIIAAQPGADLLCILLGVVLIFVNRFKSRNKSLADGKKRPDNRLMQN